MTSTPPTIADAYTELSSRREAALRTAQDLEDLSILVGAHEERPTSRPYSGLGRRLANNLIATIYETMFSSPYSRLGAPGRELTTEQETALIRASSLIFTSLEAKNQGPRCLRAIRHVIVAGSCVINNEPERIQLIPLRRYACDRTADGHTRRIITEQTEEAGVYEPDSVATTVYKEAEFYDEPKAVTVDDAESLSYGRVREQKGTDQAAKAVKGDPRHMFIVEGAEPEEDGYALPFLWYVEPELAAANQNAETMDMVAQIARRIHPVVDPSKGVTPRQYRQARPGQVFAGRDGALGWASPGAKVADYQLLAAETARHEATANDFVPLAGVFSDGKQRTAYEIMQRLRRADALTMNLLSTLATTLQRNLVISEMIHLGLANIEGIEPTVTTGGAALSEHAQFDRVLLQIARMMEVQPEITQRINSGKLAARGMTLVNADEMMLTEEELQQRAAVEAAAMQAQAPPEIPASQSSNA